MRNEVGQSERSRKNKKRREAITLVGYIVFIALILAGAVILVGFLTKDNDDQPDDAGQIYTRSVEYNGETYAPRSGVETVLFIGYDNTSDAEESMTDFDQSDLLFLVVIDKRNGKYTTIHIDRDTITPVIELTSEGKEVGEKEMQITLAYSYGRDAKMRSTNAKLAVSRLLNGDRSNRYVTINHYVTFGMDSVPVLNNVVGGVSVEVPIDIDDDLRKTAPGEKIVLTDDQALRYVRARESLSDPTNESRMIRQRNFIESFIKLFGAKVNSDEDFITNVVEKDLANKILSDDINRISELAGEAVKLKNAGYLTLEGEHKMGERFMEFYPDKDALTKMVLDVFFEKIG